MLLLREGYLPLKGLDIPGREPSCPGTDTIPYLGFVTVLLRNR